MPIETRAFSLIDVWGWCPNDGAPDHLTHFATKNPQTGRWKREGGEVECPISGSEDFDSYLEMLQRSTARV
jgi:hypothetical protein